MAAVAIPLIQAAIPALMGLFGNRGPSAEEKAMGQIPPIFLEHLQQLLGQANLDDSQAQAYWDKYMEATANMSQDGLGTPEDIRGYGESTVRDEGQVGRQQQRTQDLQEQFNNGPNAESTHGDISAILDQMGIGVGATYDTVEGVIRNAQGQVMGTIDDVERKIGEITGRTFDTAGKDQADLYNALRSRNQAGFKDQRGQVDQFKTESNAAIDRSFSPDAIAARTGRAFAPAVSSAAFRARRAGNSAMDPTYNALVARAEASRSRATDDALATGIGQQADRRLRLLDTTFGAGMDISRDEMGYDTRLSTQEEAIRRGLTLARGDAETRNVDTAGTRRIAATNTAATGFERNAVRANDDAASVYSGRISAAADRLRNSNNQLAIQAQLNEQKAKDDEAANDLRVRQFNQGMAFRVPDLSRRDAGTGAMGAAANTQFNRATTRRGQAGQFGSMAMGGYGTNQARNDANSGWGTRLASSLATAGTGMLGDWANSRAKRPTPRIGGGMPDYDSGQVAW